LLSIEESQPFVVHVPLQSRAYIREQRGTRPVIGAGDWAGKSGAGHVTEYERVG